MGYDFNLSLIWQYRHLLIIGLGVTVAITITAQLVGIIIGLVAGILGLEKRKIILWPVRAYIEFLRGTPLLVQIMWIHYVLPIILDINFSAITSGIIALSLNTGAFLAEIFRAGIQSIDRGQTEAAYSIGMSRLLAMKRIILPQAVRRMLPPFMSNFISLLKDSSLVSTIGVYDLLHRGNQLSLLTYRPIEFYSTVALIYFAVAFPLSLVVRKLEKGKKGSRQSWVNRLWKSKTFTNTTASSMS